MTQTTSVEELRGRLEAARAELEELEAERGGLRSEIERARREDHEERMRAARSGESITASKVSRVRELKDRGEELPYLVWSSRLQVLTLDIEHREALAPGLEKESDDARRKSQKAAETLRAAEERARDQSDAAVFAMRERARNWDELMPLRRELAALEASGPVE